MSSSTRDHQHHPVPAAVARVRDELAVALATPVWSLSRDELAQVLTDLHTAQNQLAALTLEVAHQADLDAIGPDHGATDTRAWWTSTTHQTHTATKRRMLLALALEQRSVVRDAMAAGLVAEDQAVTITRSLDALPTDVGTDVVDLAEKELVRLAEHHDAKALHLLGKRILTVVAPEIGEEQERRALELEDERAGQTCRFTVTDHGDGTWRGTFVLPALHGAALKKHLMAISAPKHQNATTGGRACRDHTPPEKLGAAFCEYVERYPTDHLPHAGGVSAQVNVTMTLADFVSTTDQPALLDTGQPITAATARRIACEAGIVPVVLDGQGQPLDVGQAKRFHTTAQRTAIAVRDKTCTADGCDWPPGMCHVHHDLPWSEKGKTSAENGRLLCPKHHRMAHQKKYTMKHLTNGRVVFARS